MENFYVFRGVSRLATLFVLLVACSVSASELMLDSTWCGMTSPTRMASDKVNHLVYVTSPLDHEIVVYDASGNVVNRIETAGPAGAISLAETGHLIVSVDRTVYKITTSGDIVTTYGLVNNYFVDPHDVVWTPDGRVFVADDDDQIKVFDAAGTPLFSFGSYGYFNGRLDEPVAMCYSVLTDELLVTDQNNYRIQAFGTNGDSLRRWGTEGNGSFSSAHYFRPFGIDTDTQGRIWTLDILLDLVQVYDSLGNFSFSMPLNTPEMRGGIDLAVDGNMVYVTSPSTGCVYVYRVMDGFQRIMMPRLSLTIHWTPDGLVLNWQPQPSAASYQIERSTDLVFSENTTELIGQTTETSFTDVVSNRSNAVYYYRVTTQTSWNMASRGSNPFSEHGQHNGLDTEHDSPHHVTHGVNCNSCHLRSYNEPNPRPEWWVGDHLCKSCHVETGFALAVETHLGGGTISCNVCHSPHYHQPQFERYFIRNENPVGESENMLFNHETDFIHGAPNYDGICEICHTQTSYFRNNASGDHTHNLGSDCVTCHSHKTGFLPSGGGGACNACHGAPPQTGAHLKHFGGTLEQASYGTVQNLSTDSSYIFSCGTCHPSSSSSFHNNGTLELQLYDANAPAGSLKALNPPNAAYTPSSGTCSNVYCHSATDWSSTEVSWPVMGDNGFPVFDGNRNLTYNPYEVTAFREYADMNWNGTGLDCNGCHRNGPQTSYPTVDGGVGNSHGWIDDWGYEDLHAYNMASDPLTCRVCHFGTVTAPQTWTRNNWDITTYDDVALESKALHVNGQIDVEFDPVNGGVVRDTTFSLANAAYDRDSRTCSGVPCHLTQTTPEWGKPYRWWVDTECDQCHNYSGAFGNRASLGSTHEPINGQSCARCHDPHPHG